MTLYDAIAFEFGNQISVRNGFFVAALGDRREVFEVFEELLECADRNHDCRLFSGSIGHILVFDFIGL